jgi:hypothetical protein
MDKDHATSNREAARFIDGTRAVATKALQLSFQNSDARELYIIPLMLDNALSRVLSRSCWITTLWWDYRVT